jgi:UDP-glucose-4-epimerase GalE
LVLLEHELPGKRSVCRGHLSNRRAGYIGSHAAHALRRAGYEVIVYDNLSTGFRRLAKGFELIESDVADKSRLQPVMARVDAVLHFAVHAYVGESVAAPRKYFGNNVVAALSLLNSVVDAGIRRSAFASSRAVYGVPERMPITEQTPREPVNPYGASRLFFEHALAGYSRAFGLRSVRLRYFNAAGGAEGGLHEPETHLIPLALAACAEHGSALSIHGSVYATPDATCIRDYTHVNDLADAHVRALQYLERSESDKPSDAKADDAGSLAVNLGTGRGYSVLEVIQAAERATTRCAVRRRRGSPWDGRRGATWTIWSRAHGTGCRKRLSALRLPLRLVLRWKVRLAPHAGRLVKTWGRCSGQFSQIDKTRLTARVIPPRIRPLN